MSDFMRKTTVKQFTNPDETRPFKQHGRLDLVRVGNGVIGRGVFEPGWRWSKDVKPIAGTPSCQTEHVGYVLSGRMVIAMDGGPETEIGPGDFVEIPPGHDAWTVGDEPCVLLDIAGAAHYAASSRHVDSELGTPPRH